MKYRVKLPIAITLIIVASLACSVTSLLPGGSGGLRTTNELWSDVPKIDGLGASDLEIPLVARIFMETMMSAVLSGGTGNGDVAAFTTAKTTADIQSFYTNDRMAASGWEASEQSTCLTGSDQGVEGIGLFCVFIKESATNQTGLVILGVPDDTNAAQTNVFFIRIENAVTPTP